MLAHHVISSGRFVGVKRSRTCTSTLFLVDPRWLMSCYNGINSLVFKSVRTLLSSYLVTGGLLYGLPERQRWTG